MLTIAASRYTLQGSECNTPDFSDGRSSVLCLFCNAILSMALSSATLETLKLLSLKERNELTKAKLSDIKRYLFADKVVPYHFWTGIA